MTLHLLVEGPSEHAFLERWAPRLLHETEVRIHPHQGKGELPRHLASRPSPERRGLLDQLPAKLRGFANSDEPDKHRILVLVDADNDDAEDLAAQISKVAGKVAPGLSVIVRVAVEETEAFYLGDLKALRDAFPTADMTLARSYKPDSICGTWELFGKVVNDGGGNKVAWAEAMGPVVTTRAEESRSSSFKKLVRGLIEASKWAAQKSRVPKKKYRHRSKDHRDPSRRR
jgi:hypothetical protein